MAGTIRIKKEESIGTLVMNRPKVMNALTRETVVELHEALLQLSTDEEVRVIVLEGAGNNFCSGADMSGLNRDHILADDLKSMKRFGDLVLAFGEIPQPVISKVRGVAAGGGASLAVASDFCITAQTSRFSYVFSNIGVVLDGGGHYFLPRLIGRAKAREVALLGETFNGDEAASMGLIYKSVPESELDGEVKRLAEKLAAKPSGFALGLIKRGLEMSFNRSLEEILEWETTHQAICFQDPIHKDVVLKYLESRGKTKKKHNVPDFRRT